jgi:hypothetical protein
MPPNHVAVSAGIIAVSVVVAAGIAIYESPELRRIAEDIRRRIAIALHSLGDSITPQERENLFNRPEDAEGFLQSRGINIRGEPGVDADEETRRRQREELMYWNAVADEKRRRETEKTAEALRSNHAADDYDKQLKLLELQHRERMNAGQRLNEFEAAAAASGSPRANSKRGSSFDDFLREDVNAGRGAFVVNTGADVRYEDAGLRQRGTGPRGLNPSVVTNPFADEYGIDEHVALENSLVEPAHDEPDETDIYSVSHDGRQPPTRSATLLAPLEHIPTPLVELDSAAQPPERASTPTVERQLGPDEYMTAGQEDRHDAYSSIQAWAQNSDPSFYSPLPVSPAGPLSEPELISDDGVATPTDSASLAGSGVDVADEARSNASHGQGRDYDVISDDDDTGIATPTSWTEVGSIVSESDGGAQPIHS